jgi:pimeloyl-ACP methyl ester carboxylesterase
MDAATSSESKDKFATVAGLRTRYIEEGQGPAVILMHGASLGSSADVWRRNLAPLAAYGLRVIAYDQPGFGLSDDPPQWDLGFRTAFVPRFMDELGLDGAALVGHSQSGAMAVDLALSHPDRVSRVAVLGTGSLLPPLPGQPAKKGGPAEGEEGGDREPDGDDVRAILENNLFNRALITEAAVAERLRMSTGKNHRAFLARNRAGASNKGTKEPAKKPLRERLGEVRQPLLMIYGREDRAQAGQRAELLRQQSPKLNLHIVPACKHLVQWDAEEAFHRLAGRFLRG